MARGKITKGAIDALKPSEGPVFLWDVEKPGFGVKVTPGGKKHFVLQYRVGGRGAVTKRHTIGQYGAGWTVDAAQKEVSRLLNLIDLGHDLSKDRRDRLEALRDFALNAVADRFLELEVKPNWPKSYNFAESILRLHVRPSLGSASIMSIDRAQFQRVLDNLPVSAVALRRNVYAVCNRLFNWSAGRQSGFVNPLAGMEAPRSVQSRDRILSDDELRLVWSATDGLPHPFEPWLKLLLITGQRRNEVSAMSWNELDQQRREWFLPSERAKNRSGHLVPLSDMAVQVLNALAGGEDWPRSGFVFSTTGKTPISGFSKVKRRLDDAMKAKASELQMAGFEWTDWRFHDLRRTSATTMQRLRISSTVVEAVQNRLGGDNKQGSAKVYQRYHYSDEKREALQAWGEFLRSAVSERQSNVLPLVIKAG